MIARAVFSIVLLTISLASCSSDGGSTSAEPQDEFGQIAKAIGCAKDDWDNGLDKPGDQGQIGSCFPDNAATVNIQTFTDDVAYQNWRSMVVTSGILRVFGSDWCVQTTDPAVAKKAVAYGGELVR